MTPREITELCAVNPLAWADLGQIKLGSSLFQTAGFEYMYEPYTVRPRRMCIRKSTQQGFTEMEVIKSLHGTIHGVYPKGILYLFPTRDDVSDFSSSRFKPMLVNNPGIIGAHIAETDRTNLKRIGDAFLYFRGGRLGHASDGGVKKAQQLKSIPADRLVCDELDEMDQAAIPIALQRLADSELKEESYLGNPTVPDYGIDEKFQESDQRHYFLKCRSCGHETCLEIEFPNCLRITDGAMSGTGLIINTAKAGTVFRACVKCGKEIFTKDGIWIPQAPEKSEHMWGYTISHLNSRNQDPAEILNDYQSATATNDQQALTSIFNLRLGKPYIAAENRLRRTDVLACCGQDPMLVAHSGPCAAGADVGKDLNIVIGCKVGNKLKILKTARVSTFNDAHDLFSRFNVRSAVFDLKPEIRKVREFCANAAYSCFGCDYQENQRGVAAWDEKSRVVVVNRNEVLDATHNLVVTPGLLELPRCNDELEVFATQMCNTAKILEEDKDTGNKTYRYRGKVGGPDDYRHAMNYFFLASSRIQAIVHRTAPMGKSAPYYYG